MTGVRAPASLFVVAVVVAASMVAAGCSKVPFRPLEIGQCLPAGAQVEGRRAQSPETVPCSGPHRYQVFHVGLLRPPEDGWPGDDEITANAEQLCVGAIRAVTGIDPADTPDDVELLHIDPTRDSWHDGDREVECLFRWDAVTTDTLVPTKN